MDWTDPQSGERTKGFKEMGFLPDAFINLLALLGWNDGSGQEIFSKEELIQHFSVERIHKAGAKFDFEKAKWYNHEWIKICSTDMLLPLVEDLLSSHQIHASHQMLQTTIPLTKERCHLINDFLPQLKYFFVDPVALDTAAVKPKWDEKKAGFFQSFVNEMKSLSSWNIEAIEQCFKELAQAQGLKPGDVQLPFRVMLVGGKFGPAVLEIAATIGKKETLQRINHCIQTLNAKS